MIPAEKIDDVYLAFPADVTELMPKIPEGFRPKDWSRQLFADWFYFGVMELKLVVKPGIDPNKAVRHIRAIMGSFQPKHEEKTAACEYLFEEWFEGAEWKKDNRVVPA